MDDNETVETPVKNTTLSNHQGEFPHWLTQKQETNLNKETLQTNFIANISHDIRTPLSGLVGMSESLLQEIQAGTFDTASITAGLEIVKNSATEIAALLNEVLEATIERENPAQHSKFDLLLFLKKLKHLEYASAYSKGLFFELLIDERLPQFIEGDKKKCHRILLNLLGNAIKFTKKGGVTFSAHLVAQTQEAATIEFKIVDTGIGIPEDMQELVFDEFFRLSPSYKGDYKGLGLGLTQVKKLVHQLGGKVALESHPNQGTTVFVELTFKKVRSTNKEIASPVIHKDLNKNLHVLFIEDDLIIKTITEHLLKAKGLQFKSFTNATSAFECFTSETFDLVLTDIGLPDFSGIELTNRMRAWEKQNHRQAIPIVGVSAHTQEAALVAECQIAGMNGVYLKPFTADKLSEVITKFTL